MGVAQVLLYCETNTKYLRFHIDLMNNDILYVLPLGEPIKKIALRNLPQIVSSIKSPKDDLG